MARFPVTFCKAASTFILGICLCYSESSAQTVFSDKVVRPRARVIVDNDFSGDPDGLFQLVHQLLSPSVEVRAIIGSHLRAGDFFDNSHKQAENAASKASEVLKLLKMTGKIPVVPGSNFAMPNDSTPVKSKAVDFIIQEALRTDTKLPLYVVCGAGLTEIASAVLTNPSIAKNITLVWIGGPEYPGVSIPPPNYTPLEYNLAIDIAAGMVIFNKSDIKLWQVPRNAYRQTLLSYSELLVKVKPSGEVGKFLSSSIETLMGKLINVFNVGETYILGDSPLVLLTALQSSFEPDPSSSDYKILMAPKIDAAGLYNFNHNGRNIRVYDQLDVRLMFDDFFAKLALHESLNK